MTVEELAQRFELERIVVSDGTREITGGYVGDLLSWVMGRAQEGDAWITVMGNINTIAVAVLADTACILLSDNSPLDTEALERAKIQKINILRSDRSSFELAGELYRLLA